MVTAMWLFCLVKPRSVRAVTLQVACRVASRLTELIPTPAGPGPVDAVAAVAAAAAGGAAAATQEWRLAVRPAVGPTPGAPSGHGPVSAAVRVFLDPVLFADEAAGGL